MHPRDLTPIEIADLLDAMYRQDLGERGDGPDLATRSELADYLGCHEDARAAALEAWRELLAPDPSVDLEHVEYWLDVEFIEPCPRDRVQ